MWTERAPCGFGSVAADVRAETLSRVVVLEAKRPVLPRTVRDHFVAAQGSAAGTVANIIVP